MRYGTFRFGTCFSMEPYRTFEFSDLADNIDKLNATNIKILAGSLFIEGRSKKSVKQLRIEIADLLRTTTTNGSTDINKCLSNVHPDSNRLWTVQEFVDKCQNKKN